MADQIVYLVSTGLVYGDLTIDWVKKISNNSTVSGAMTLSEYGDGVYRIQNTNVTTSTGDVAFRVHETATSDNYAVGIFSPADNDLALDSTVAKEATVGALNNFDPTSDTVANVTTVATTSTNTDMRGTDNAALDATVAKEATVAALNNISVADIEASTLLIDLHDEAFGKWVLDHGADTLTLYKANGVTVLKQFNLTSTAVAVPNYIERNPV